MCSHRNWFSIYESYHRGVVVIANNAVSNSIGIDMIHIHMHDDVVRMLTKVRHVHDLCRSLISLGAFNHNGYEFLASNGYGCQ